MAFMAIFVEQLVAYCSFLFFASVTPHECVLIGQAEQLLDSRGNQTRATIGLTNRNPIDKL